MKTTINLSTARELEEAVICALLLHPTQLPEVVVHLQPDMFETPQLAFIYQAILQQYHRGEQPDYLTTDAEMRRMDAKRTEEQKGLAVLGSSLYRQRNNQNLMKYLEEVKRLFLLRQLKLLFQSFAGKAAESGTEPLRIVGEAEQQLLQLREKFCQGDPIEHLPKVAEEAIEHYRQRQADKGKGFRVLTRLRELDAIYGGFHSGELIVIGGRPAEGKTALAMHIAFQVAKSGTPVLIYSLEMTALQTMNRFFTGYAEVEPERLRSYQLQKEDFDRMNRFTLKYKELPLWISVDTGQSVENIRAQTLLMKRKGVTGLVIVDYIQMLEKNSGCGYTVDQMVGANITALKTLALSADCPVIAVSQLNRESERRQDKRSFPELTDLRDSGVIEQVADGVFFVCNPERHGIVNDPENGKSTRNLSYLIVRKHRNGATGIARAKHNATFTRFINHDENF